VGPLLYSSLRFEEYIFKVTQHQNVGTINHPTIMITRGHLPPHRVRLTFPRINRGWGLAQVVMVVDTVVLADERGLPAVATHEPGFCRKVDCDVSEAQFWKGGAPCAMAVKQ
jgi:hypothetical protein